MAPGGNTNPDPDVLIFTDGERLVGQLESATGSSVVFKSNVVGEVTVDWRKIQELRSSQVFAVIPKNMRLRLREDEARAPQGTLTEANQQLQIKSASGAVQTMLPGNVANVVPEPVFEGAFQRRSFFTGWTGGASLGIALTYATQDDRTFTGAVNLVRSVPAESWLDLRSRTLFTYTQSYGEITQPLTPTVKTSLFHIGLEQDWYLTPRVFLFAEGLWDHSYSQGLDLQQTYGGGVGWVALKSDKDELDFKASMDYINQQFEDSFFNKSLIGSIFGETYTRTFGHGILLNEQAAITPAWNDTSAYSAFASAGITVPVYHHFGLTLGALDTFLNDPPPGFKKNSFQFTAGATYSIR